MNIQSFSFKIDLKNFYSILVVFNCIDRIYRLCITTFIFYKTSKKSWKTHFITHLVHGKTLRHLRVKGILVLIKDWLQHIFCTYFMFNVEIKLQHYLETVNEQVGIIYFQRD